MLIVSVIQAALHFFQSIFAAASKYIFTGDRVDTVAPGGMFLHSDEHGSCCLFLVNPTYTILLS